MIFQWCVWFLYDLSFFYLRICIFLAIIKKINSFYYLKFDILYSINLLLITLIGKLSPKMKIKLSPTNLCGFRGFRLKFACSLSVCLLLFAKKRNENIFKVKELSKIDCKSNFLVQLKSENKKNENDCGRWKFFKVLHFKYEWTANGAISLYKILPLPNRTSLRNGVLVVLAWVGGRSCVGRVGGALTWVSC